MGSARGSGWALARASDSVWETESAWGAGVGLGVGDGVGDGVGEGVGVGENHATRDQVLDE